MSAVRIEIQIDSKTGETRMVALGDKFDRLGDKGRRSFNKIEGASNKLKRSMALMTRFLSVGLFAEFGRRMLTMAASYETTYFQMTKTFEGASDKMIQKAKDMSEAFNHYYDFQEISYAFTKTADSMERYGITGEKYFGLVARAADVGAAKGLQLKESIDRLESAMRGEAEASEYLGVTLGDTYMKSMALNGAFSDQWEKMTDVEKAVARYNELLRQTAKYSGSAREATETLTGAVSSLFKRINEDIGTFFAEYRRGEKTFGDMFIPPEWEKQQTDFEKKIGIKLSPSVVDAGAVNELVGKRGAVEAEISRLEGELNRTGFWLTFFKGPGYADSAQRDLERLKTQLREINAEMLKLTERRGKGLSDIAGLAAAESKVLTLQQAIAETETVAEDAAEKALEKTKETALDAIKTIAENDRKVLQDRLSEYERFYTDLQAKIQQHQLLEKQHIRELNALYQQQADIRRSTSEMISELELVAKSPAEQYEARRSALGRQFSAAMGLSGQERVQALEEYKQAVASLARQFESGIKGPQIFEQIESFAVTSKHVIETAVSDIQRAGAAQQQAMQQLAAEKRSQIEADRTWGESLQQTARDTTAEMDLLKATIADLSSQISAMDKLIEVDAVDRATPVVQQIQSAVDALHDKTITITTIHQTINAGAESGAGGAADSFAAGTMYVPQTALYQLHRGEMVLNRQESNQVRQGAGRSNRSVNFENLIINVPQNAAPNSPADWRRIVRDHIKPELNKLN